MSYSLNGDNLIFLIKTDNAHKERTLLPTIINTFEKCKGEGREVETESKRDDDCFHNYRNKLLSGKLIQQFGTVPLYLLLHVYL